MRPNYCTDDDLTLKPWQRRAIHLGLRLSEFGTWSIYDIRIDDYLELDPEKVRAYSDGHLSLWQELVK